MQPRRFGTVRPRVQIRVAVAVYPVGRTSRHRLPPPGGQTLAFAVGNRRSGSPPSIPTLGRSRIRQSPGPSPACAQRTRTTFYRRLRQRLSLPVGLMALPQTPARGYTREDFATHIRNEYSTFRWLLEPMLVTGGFEVEPTISPHWAASSATGRAAVH
jgi:hypothetical protein